VESAGRKTIGCSLDSVPQVSVVIPVHNRETLIGRAIDSVLRQTYTDFELLVVDDGSTDGTVARVQAQTGDPRLRLLRHTTNRGAAAARNTAIMAARGEFIAFLDSDDEWLPDKLERQVACLASAPPDMLMCCSGYWMVRERSREVAARIPRARGSWREALWDGCTLSPGSTAFIRRRAFDIHGLFDERLGRLEDWDWLLRYARGHDLTVVAEPLARIHIAERMRGEAVHEAVTLMRAKHAAVMRRLGFWPAARFRAALLMEEAVTGFYAGRYLRAVLYFIGSLATYPRKPAGFFGRIAPRALRLLRRSDRAPATSGWLYRNKPER
jgi:glycosyltransferase involved in cell wall biosynthesis